MARARDRHRPGLGGASAARARIVGGGGARGRAQARAALLPGLIERVLAEAGTDLSAIEVIVLGDGPGSFTGLRVGAAVAKALVRTRGVALHVDSRADGGGVGRPARAR